VDIVVPLLIVKEKITIFMKKVSSYELSLDESNDEDITNDKKNKKEVVNDKKEEARQL